MKKFIFIFISSIILFLLNIPAHFLFNWFDYKIVGFFFPVNESIFQHMKMIFTCFFMFYVGLFFLRKKLNYNNIFTANLVSSLSCIISFLLVYIPIYLSGVENMIITFILLFITIAIGQFIATYIIVKENNSSNELLSIILIFLIFVLNIALTNKPIKNFIFWDDKHGTYNEVHKN